MCCNYKFLLILLIAGYLESLQSSLETFDALISGVIDELCPDQNICRSNNSSLTKRSPVGSKSCCTDCSCRDSCSLNGNCCFPTTESTEYHRDQTCISTWIPKPTGKDQYLYSSYYMYTDPPISGCPAGIANTVIKESVTSLENMSPVSSNRTNKIYINAQVAECHGEFNTTNWQTLAFCNEGVGSVFDMMPNDGSTFNCTVQFQYQGDKTDIQSERCYPGLVSSCGIGMFKVPDEIKLLSQHEVRLACESGFLSPYVSVANFANIFCHICNTNRSATSCDSNHRSHFSRAFQILLNGEGVRHIQNNGFAISKETRTTVCPTDTSHPAECRTVLCPTGQFMSDNGRCEWLSKALLKQRFALFLKLVPNSPLPMKKIKESDVRVYPSWLTSPWPPTWKTIQINYEYTDDEENPKVKHIWIEQKINWKGKEVENLVRATRAHLTKRWTALIGNVTIELDQFIDARKYFIGTYYRYAGSSRTVRNVNVHRLYDTLASYELSAFFTKPYFCELVELYEHEYTTIHIKEAITYMRTNKTLNAGEISLRLDDNGQYNVLICVEDSGFVYHSSACPNDTPTYMTVFVAFLYAIERCVIKVNTRC